MNAFGGSQTIISWREWLEWHNCPCAMALKIDFSIMYTTPPYSKLKDGLKQIAQLCLIKKTNGQHKI
jgi:hypothetical protein